MDVFCEGGLSAIPSLWGRRGVVGGLDGELSRLVVGRFGRFLWMDFFSTREVPSPWLASTPRESAPGTVNDESNCFSPL